MGKGERVTKTSVLVSQVHRGPEKKPLSPREKEGEHGFERSRVNNQGT